MKREKSLFLHKRKEYDSFGREYAATTVDEDENAFRGKLLKGQEPGGTAWFAYDMYEWQLPQYRGVLEPGHSHLHDSGRDLHAELQVLRGEGGNPCLRILPSRRAWLNRSD